MFVRQSLDTDRVYSRTPLMRINWEAIQPDMQKIRIIGFFVKQVTLVVWRGKVYTNSSFGLHI